MVVGIVNAFIFFYTHLGLYIKDTIHGIQFVANYIGCQSKAVGDLSSFILIVTKSYQFISLVTYSRF